MFTRHLDVEGLLAEANSQDVDEPI